MALTLPIIGQPIMQVSPPPVDQEYRVDGGAAPPQQPQPDSEWSTYYARRRNAAKVGKTVIRAEGEKGGSYMETFDGLPEGNFMEKVRAEYEAEKAGGGAAVRAPRISDSRYGNLLGNAPPPTSSVAPEAATARLDAARQAVQSVKSAQEAAAGIRNTASGTTVIAGPKGDAFITPTGPGGVSAPKVLASPHGSGSVVFGPRTTASRINQGGTYNPNFHTQTSAAPAPAAPPTGPATPTPAQPAVQAPVLAARTLPKIRPGTPLGAAATPPAVKPLTTGADSNPALAAAIGANIWAEDPMKAAKKSLMPKTTVSR